MPRRVREEVQLGPPAGVRIRKKRKIKNKGGGVICAPSAVYERVPNVE